MNPEHPFICIVTGIHDLTECMCKICGTNCNIDRVKNWKEKVIGKPKTS